MAKGSKESATESETKPNVENNREYVCKNARDD